MAEESYFTLEENDKDDDASSGLVKPYNGEERRRGSRRSGQDRRKEVRFEMGKEDRRDGEGRREDDHTPKFW